MSTPDRRPPPRLPGLSETLARDLPAPAPLPTRVVATPGPTDTPGGQPGGGTTLVPGQILARRYEVRAEVGRGGMGVVYAALDRVRGEEVALKVLLPHLLADPAARARFIAEVAAATRLSHPHVVRVFDVHEADGLTFLTMEILRGASLRAELDSRAAAARRFTPDEVRHLGRQLCDALHYAHGQGVVHRDVKPENIWLADDGSVKLMDFGIARVLTPRQLTTTGVALGTAYYMAPEQLKGTDVDHRADQYAAGVVLYELLTGEVPVGAAAPPHQARRGVPRTLSEAVMRALSGRPAARHPDTAALAAALAASGGARWPRWAAAVAVLVAVAAGGALFGPQVVNRVTDSTAATDQTQTTGPTRDQAAACLARADAVRESLDASLADLPANLHPADAARAASRARDAATALKGGDFGASAEAAEEAARLAQGAKEQAGVAARRWTAAQVTLKELGARRDHWLRVAPQVIGDPPPAAAAAEAEYQAARVAVEAGDLDPLSPLAERAGRGFDAAAQSVAAATRVRVERARAEAGVAVKKAERVGADLAALVREADQAVQRLEAKKAPEPELRLARLALRDSTRIQKAFETSDRLQGLLRGATEAKDGGEGLARDQPREAEQLFARAKAEADEFVAWLRVVRLTLPELARGWERVAEARMLPDAPAGWADWPAGLLEQVPDRLFDRDGKAALTDARTAADLAAELPALLRTRQVAAEVGSGGSGMELTQSVVEARAVAAAVIVTGDKAVRAGLAGEARQRYATAVIWNKDAGGLVAEARDVLRYRKIASEVGSGGSGAELTRQVIEARATADAKLASGDTHLKAGRGRAAKERYLEAVLWNEATGLLVAEARDVLVVRAGVVAAIPPSAEWVSQSYEIRRLWDDAAGELAAGDADLRAGQARAARERFAAAARRYDTLAGQVTLARTVAANEAVGRGYRLSGTKDYPAALREFDEALRLKPGHIPALNGRGHLYTVTKKYKEAAIDLRASAEQGDSYSQATLGYLYDMGQGVGQDYLAARRWYEKAAEQGQASAQCNLGTLYRHGRGVVRDYVAARRWYEKAAEKGNANAQCNLGIMYLEAQGVDRDYEAARRWFEKSAEKGDANAQVNLGLMYEQGRGVSRDLTVARSWFEKSAAQGDETARERLRALRQP